MTDLTLIDVFSLECRTTAAFQEAASGGGGRAPLPVPGLRRGSRESRGRGGPQTGAGRGGPRPPGPASIRELMTEPILVMSTKPLGELFDLMKRHRKDSFAVVLDEYGGLAGVVTISGT
ncbi:MAG: CBS domain-containing protein [Desulfomicrobium escambiense]|nr:CBS domain-containing protein [Desulfomicrobium escambiense]